MLLRETMLLLSCISSKQCQQTQANTKTAQGLTVSGGNKNKGHMLIREIHTVTGHYFANLCTLRELCLSSKEPVILVSNTDSLLRVHTIHVHVFSAYRSIPCKTECFDPEAFISCYYTYSV